MSRRTSGCQFNFPRSQSTLLLTLTCLALLGLTAWHAPADEVECGTGRVLRGIIEEESPQSVRILVSGMNRMTVPRREITAIRRQSPAENARLMGDLYLEQGLLWEATSHYAEALDQGLAPEELAAGFLTTPTAIVALTQQQSPDHAVEIRNFFLRLLSELSPQDDVLHLAGRLCEVTGDRARARDAYDRIGAAWWADHPDESRQAAQFYLAEARQALAQDDFPGVLSAFEQMTVVDITLAQQLRPVFLIRWANSLIAQGDYEPAVELVGESVAPVAPQIARLWMESVFSELKNGPEAGRSLEDIVPIFARLYPRYFPDDADEVLADLYERLGEEYLRRGQYALAHVAFSRHYDITEAPSTDRPLLLTTSFEERAAQLLPDDWEGRLQVTMEMVSHELWRPALEQLDTLMQAPDTDIHVYAIQQRRAIEGRLAAESMGRAFDLYKKGDYPGALDVLTQDAELIRDARLTDNANELRHLCQDRMNEEPNRRALAALAMYQRAERHFYAGQYAESVALLRGLLHDYADTPVVDDARVMLNVARQFLAVRNPTEGPFNLAQAEEATAEEVASPETVVDARRREFENLLDAVAPSIGSQSSAATP